MIVISKENQDEIMRLVPSMEQYMDEWQVVNAKVANDNAEIQQQVLDTLHYTFSSSDGLIIKVGSHKVVMVVRGGEINDYTNFRRDLEQKLAKLKVLLIIRKLSPSILRQIQLDLTDTPKHLKLSLYQERLSRDWNVFLIADDDELFRQATISCLEEHGAVLQLSKGDSVKDKYLSCNPDLVILDIHMPGKDGLSLIEDILEVDTDAFIIIVSSDSKKDNVLEAVSLGAMGFLAKPIVRERLVSYLSRCYTYQRLS